MKRFEGKVALVTGVHLVVDGGLTARTGQPIVPP